MTDKTTVVFLGTPEFSCNFLEKLAHHPDFEVIGVITQEDKPMGRKKLMTSPPVKIAADTLNLTVFQPTRLNKDTNLITQLKKLAPDYFVVVAYGQIISKEVLEIPKIAPINVHGSILPDYRGASPIQQSLLNGDKQTGLSIMKMDVGMDTGPVYKTIPLEILPDDTDLSLRNKLSSIGSELLPEILLDIKKGVLKAHEQDSSKATYCGKIEKEDGLIDPFNMTSIEVYNKWRAFIIWPGIYIYLNNKKIQLLDISPISNMNISPGEFETTKNQIFMGCKNGVIGIKKLQLEGKSAQNANVFLSGNKQLMT